MWYCLTTISPMAWGLYFLPTIFKYSKQTAVIMMSALRSSSIEKEAIEQGAVAFLEKPFKLAEIKETIRRIEYGHTGVKDQGLGNTLFCLAHTCQSLSIFLTVSG